MKCNFSEQLFLGSRVQYGFEGRIVDYGAEHAGDYVCRVTDEKCWADLLEEEGVGDTCWVVALWSIDVLVVQEFLFDVVFDCPVDVFFDHNPFSGCVGSLDMLGEACVARV